MLTADQLHHAAMRKVAAGDRMATRGRMGKARCWWRYAARQEEAAGCYESAAELWRRSGNEERARECEGSISTEEGECKS